MAEPKSCNSAAGLEYTHGTNICKTDKCAKCVDGVWEETNRSCQGFRLVVGAGG
jgi:hypothetical protein